MESTYNSSVNKYVVQFQDILENSLLSIKILFPKDSNLDSLTSILWLKNENDYNQYLSLDNSFINKIGGRISRTLMFLKYNEYEKYDMIQCSCISNAGEKENGKPNIFFDPEIKITENETELNDFKKQENIDPFWKAWLNCIRDYFPKGKSTLWSYIVLRQGDKELIASAYLIFSDKVKEEDRRLINKKCQDLLYESIVTQYFNELKIQANRNAISQTIVRTTSHNNGSHIMTNDYEDLYVNDFFYDLTPIKNYRHYLRERMLLNADISFYSDPSFTTVKLETVCISFQDLNIVTEYISGIKEKVFCKFENTPDISVALPNGVLGYQAFYVFVENLIRNYFKYNHSNNVQLNLCLKLNLSDYIHSEYNCFEISHNPCNPITGEQWTRINNLIESPILENNKLRTEGLGFIEIKAFLLYLNGIDPVNIDNAVLPETSFKVFEILPYNECKDNLTFRFWLRKPIDIRIPSKSNKLENGVLESDIEDTRNRMAPFFYYDEKELLDMPLSNYLPLALYIALVQIQNCYPFTIAISLKRMGEINKYCVVKLNKSNNNKYLFENNNNFKFDDSNCESKDNITIAFDNHGSVINQICGLKYYHPYGSFGLGKLLNNLSKESYPTLKHIIIEAFETKLVILDERLQRFSENKIKVYYKEYNKECKMQFLYSRANIFIPKNDILQLNDQNFDDTKKCKINNYLISLNLTPNDFVIIHLGIIEKFLVDKGKKEVLAFLNEIKPCNIDLHQFVLTSERGTPSNVPIECRFVHFSNLSKYLIEIENYSKLNLVELVINSRNTKNY